MWTSGFSSSMGADYRLFVCFGHWRPAAVGMSTVASNHDACRRRRQGADDWSKAADGRPALSETHWHSEARPWVRISARLMMVAWSRSRRRNWGGAREGPGKWVGHPPQQVAGQGWCGVKKRYPVSEGGDGMSCQSDPPSTALRVRMHELEQVSRVRCFCWRVASARSAKFRHTSFLSRKERGTGLRS